MGSLTILEVMVRRIDPGFKVLRSCIAKMQNQVQSNEIRVTRKKFPW